MAFDYSANKAKLGEGYISAVERAGGIPLAVPPLQDDHVLKVLVQKLDGIILSGGPDIDPSYFNQLPHPRLGKVCPKGISANYTLLLNLSGAQSRFWESAAAYK